MSQVAVRKALYGNVAVDRAFCPECQQEAFVVKGRMACCDLVVNKRLAKKKPIERMSQPERKRRQPTVEEKMAILSDQNHRCFWCNTPFSGVAVRIGRRSQKIVKLLPCWDHVEPFEWSYNNSPLNFVAACSICNGIKSSKMFPSLEETRDHIMRRREARGWQ